MEEISKIISIHDLNTKIKVHEEKIIAVNCTLDKLENRLDDISTDLKEIKRYFSEHQGAVKLKTKIWNALYLIVTIVLALIANDFILSKIGI